MVRALSACRRRVERRDDDGFSLVETTVAVAIALVVFIAVAGVLIATTKASLLARQNQQSIDAASEGIERARSHNFAAVAMVPSDLAGDSNLTPSGTSYVIDPDGPVGSLPVEPVVAEVGGAINPHLRSVERNTTTFQVYTYVTKPAADALQSAADYRRVTVLVRWTTGTKVRERRTSTIVTNTRRGLPLPKFEFGSATTIPVNSTATVHLPFTVTNRGAPDRWNLSWSSAPAVTWTFTWRQDANANGLYDTGEAEFTDSASDADGTIDTGLIYTDQAVKGVLTAVVPVTATPGLPYRFTLTAQSSSQPTAATATQSFVSTVTVVASPGLCTGCTLTSYFLQNETDAADRNTRQRPAMVLTTTPPATTATTLYNFDTDIDSRPGRRLLPGGVGSGDSRDSYNARWDVDFATATTFGPLSGSANITLTFWARRVDGSSGGLNTFRAYLRHVTTGQTRVTVASGSIAVTGLNDWVPVTITIPVAASNAFTVPSNKKLGLDLQVDNSTNSALELAYDTITYPSSIRLPKR